MRKLRKWILVALAVAALAAITLQDLYAPYGDAEYGPLDPEPTAGGAEWEDLRPLRGRGVRPVGPGVVDGRRGGVGGPASRTGSRAAR